MLDYTEYDKIIKECKSISIIKNKDYGTASLALFGGLSILIRMNDKIQRLNMIIEKNKLHVSDETAEDTIKDLINYSIYLIMHKRGRLEKK
jgi:hypothetical protein